jgi:hypothetical protein
MDLALAQMLASLASVVVYGTLSVLYLIPWMRTQAKATALLPLLLIHVFRYIALSGFSAQAAGFPASDAQEMRVVVGDVIGATIAFLAIVALRFRSPLTTPLAWLLVIETLYDIVNNVRGGASEHLFAHTNGVGWMIVALYVPMIVVSLPVISWQLVSRRRESLNSLTPRTA